MSRLGDVLAATRRRRGLTQVELGARLSVSRETIGRWERGVQAPPLTALPAICRALRVRPEIFVDLPLRRPERYDLD